MPKRRFKKFSISLRDPLVFELGGIEFECLPELDYRIYRDFVAEATDANENNGIDFIVDNIKNCLVSDDEREKFNSLVTSSDVIIPVKYLVEIFQWLMEQYEITQPPADAPKR